MRHFETAGCCKQLSLLMWKNWLLKKNEPCSTVCEIIMPVIAALLLLAIRQAVPASDIAQCIDLLIHLHTSLFS